MSSGEGSEYRLCMRTSVLRAHVGGRGREGGGVPILSVRGVSFHGFCFCGEGKTMEKTNLDTCGIHLGVTNGKDVAIAQRFSAFGPSVLLHHHSPSVPFRVVLEWCLTDRWGTDIEFGDDGILTYYNISQQTKKKKRGGTYKVFILRPLCTPLA